MHKFKVGERVRFSGARLFERGATGIYDVVSQLPAEQGDQQYRIRSTDGPRERVAKEDQLTAATAR